MATKADIPSLRQARVSVKIDGQLVDATIDARVVSTNYYSADWFQVSFALASGTFPSISYLSDTGAAEVTVGISVDNGVTFSDLIVGRADTVVADPINQVARMEGRDLSGSMVDSPLQQTFVNQNASAIAAMIALSHGLDIDVVPTPDLFGRADGTDYTTLGLGQFCRDQTEWDLIVRLAQQVGYDAYVSGRTFYFRPVASRSTSMVVVTTDEVIGVQLERRLEIADNPLINLATWDYLSQTQFGDTGNSAALGGVHLTGRRQVYSSLPNMTPAALAWLATQRRDEMFRHQRSINLTMPGNLEIWPRSQVLLSGTGSAFDRKYDVECVDRVFGPTTGFRQHIRARQVP